MAVTSFLPSFSFLIPEQKVPKEKRKEKEEKKKRKKLSSHSLNRTDGQADGRTDGRTDGQTERRTDGQTLPLSCVLVTTMTEERERKTGEELGKEEEWTFRGKKIIILYRKILWLLHFPQL